MKIFKVLLLTFGLVSSASVMPLDAPKDKEPTAKRRNLPKVDKRRMSRFKRLIKKKKLAKIKKDKLKNKKLVAMQTKKGRRKEKRLKRLKLLRRAKDRLNNSGTIQRD